MKTPMINTTIKKIAALIFMITVGMVAATAVARADGIITPQEQRFGDQIAGSLCDYIGTAGVNVASMTEAMGIIYDHTPAHMGMDDAVDIINYTVQNYCPSHWDELVAFGEGFRGGSYA